MIIFLANDQGKKVVRKLARLLLFMLVSGFFAKIVDSGLLSKVCLSFVSEKGGKGVRGRGERSDGLPRWSWRYYYVAWFSSFSGN